MKYLVLQCVLPLLLGITLQAQPQRTDRELAQARLHEAITETSRLESPISQVAILEQAGPSLGTECISLCASIFKGLYAKILNPPESSKGKLEEPDLYSLFQRFVGVVARYDPKLAIWYVKDFARKQENSRQELALWAAANTILDADMPGSIRLASLAAQSSSFPDSALLYLEKLRTRSPQDADAIAAITVEHLAALSDNARLQLLAYVIPSARIPEIVGESLFTKDIPDRHVLSGFSSRNLVGYFVRAVAAAPLRGQKEELLVLRILEEKIRVAEPAFLPIVKQAITKAVEQYSVQELQNSLSEASRWMASEDFLQQSIEGAEAQFQKSRQEKYRDRATLLKALALSKTADYAGALALLSALPFESRGNATDAVLLYAANAVRDSGQANDLARIARAETRNRFVLGYALLTAARLGFGRSKEATIQAANSLSEIEQIAQELRTPAERFSLKLGVAMLWARRDPVRGQAALASVLRDMNDIPSDGIPNVHLIIAIPGTRVEYKLPAGSATVYDLVRTLAHKDLRATLANIEFASGEELQLRCIVSATAERLSSRGPRK